jgi:hypothetical protein
VTDNNGTSMSMGMDGTIGASGSLGGLACGDYSSMMSCAQ